MAHPNEQLIRDYFAALAAQDGDRAASFFADDVVVHIGGRNELSGDYRGLAEWQGFMRKSGEVTGGTWGLELHDALGSDDHAVVLAKAHLEKDGKRFEWNRVAVYHVEGGKITEIWVTDDDPYTVDEYFA